MIIFFFPFSFFSLAAIVGLLFAAWHAASLLKIPIATFGMDGGERSTTGESCS